MDLRKQPSYGTSSNPDSPNPGGELLAQYFRGITGRLRAEIEFISTLFVDPSIIGDGSRQLLRDLVARFIPARYGVGSGVVIDRQGNQSRVCDIVIFDKTYYPSILALEAAHLFPVDFVYATIDIRPRLSSDEVKESLAAVASVRRLEIVSEEFMLPEARDGGISVRAYRPTPPVSCVFAFESNVKQSQAYKEWFTPRPELTHLYPRLVGCLDQGVVQMEDDDLRAYTLPVMKSETGFLATIFRADSAVHEGVVYPVKQVKGNFALIDQSRVLLFFILLLNDMLAVKRINPALRLTDHFLQGPLSSVVEI
jgi:hypothetical protein